MISTDETGGGVKSIMRGWETYMHHKGGTEAHQHVEKYSWEPIGAIVVGWRSKTVNLWHPASLLQW